MPVVLNRDATEMYLYSFDRPLEKTIQEIYSFVNTNSDIFSYWKLNAYDFVQLLSLNVFAENPVILKKMMKRWLKKNRAFPSEIGNSITRNCQQNFLLLWNTYSEVKNEFRASAFNGGCLR